MRRRASGITTQQIDSTLNDAFGQRQVSTIYNALNQYHVVMEVAPQFQQDPSALEAIHVQNKSGQMVPLSAFAHYAPGSAPLAVNHQGQFAATTISFNLPPGVSLGEAYTAIALTMARIGMPTSIHGSSAGTGQLFAQSQSQEPWLILAALLAVYIVLGVLYESYVHPLTILSTLPSAGVGAIVALLICRTEFSLIALIGVILLIGIVKKNAIMLIDVALDAERNRGMSAHDAIFHACLLRLRPILMTTLAAMLGAMPLALGFGEGSEMRRPLGISIVGGLLVSQVLTLYTTPVVYLYWIASACGASAAGRGFTARRRGVHPPRRVDSGQVRFEEPQRFVEFARYAGEQVRGVGVALLGGGVDRGARGGGQRGVTIGQRGDGTHAVDAAIREFLQARGLRRHARGAVRHAGKRGDAFGDVVHGSFEFFGELVEQLVQGDEVFADDVPVRLLDLGLQVQRVGELLVEQGDHARAQFRRDVDAGTFVLGHDHLLFDGLRTL